MVGTIVDIFLESTEKFKDQVALQMVSEKNVVVQESGQGNKFCQYN